MIALNLQSTATPGSERGRILGLAVELTELLRSARRQDSLAQRAAELYRDLQVELPRDTAQPVLNPSVLRALDALDELDGLLALSGSLQVKQRNIDNFIPPDPRDDWRPELRRKLALIRTDVADSLHDSAFDGSNAAESVRQIQAGLEATVRSGQIVDFDFSEATTLLNRTVRALTTHPLQTA